MKKKIIIFFIIDSSISFVNILTNKGFKVISTLLEKYINFLHLKINLTNLSKTFNNKYETRLNLYQ